jgi:hypothetical protein
MKRSSNMIRNLFATKYNFEVLKAIMELFDICKSTMCHSGDLLVCQQNGFIDFGRPCFGVGETGLNYIQQLNQVNFHGMGRLSDDIDCFNKSRTIIFNGTSEFENLLKKKCISIN